MPLSIEGHLKALEEMLKRSSGRLNSEAMRQQARVSTLRDILNTLRDEAANSAGKEREKGPLKL